MEAFEDDENPFETEPERLQSDSSSSRANISGLSSPVPQQTRVASPPTSPGRRNTFPSPGSHRQPQAFKNDFCCLRDRWLHSGEDAEILVRSESRGDLLVSMLTCILLDCMRRLRTR